MAEKDEYYIKRCLELARKGAGYVSPNPMVGCVIVKNGKIIGEGYHKEFGKAHAEVNAINNSKENVANSTLYVNLEPCSVFGKTPPCTDLIISRKISKVITGTLDPNPAVNGKGIKKLESYGIITKTGILESECKKLNRKFFKYIKTGIPFVTLKIAQTIDSKISIGKNDKNNISSPESQKMVHILRSVHDAVLIGSNTVNIDNPYLTIRHNEGRQPFRVILDPNLNIKMGSNVLNDEYTERTILITSAYTFKQNVKKSEYIINKGARIYPLKAGKDNLFHVKEILYLLGGLKISSILVEGGRGVFTAFLKEKCVDDLMIFIAPKIYGKGVPAIDFMNSVLRFENYSIQKVGNDILFSAIDISK